MEVLEFETPEEKETKPLPVCPSKIIVLALARDHRGVRAKLLAETLHRRFPDDYHKPLVKFYHDIGWRDTLIRLRKASMKWDYLAPVIVFVNKKLIGDDDDFNLFIRQKHFLLADPKKIRVFKNMSLLDKLQMDPLKTYVYFDISIDYRPCGRMIFQIEGDTMPKSTTGFLQLCCSQKIPLPAGQHKRSKFAGSLIKRIVREGWVRIDTIDNDRVYAKGKYEKPALTHDRRGTLSMNIGPRGWLSSHVMITLDQHPWMEKLYRAIGVLIDGEHVLHMLENVNTTYENPDVDVVITDNGILHSPNLMTTEGFLTPEMRDASEKLKAFKDEYKSVLATYVNAAQLCQDPGEDVKTEKIESNQNETDGEGLDVVQSGLSTLGSHASLLVSKSRITNFSSTLSKFAVCGSERPPKISTQSFRGISSKRGSGIPSFGNAETIEQSKSDVNSSQSGMLEPTTSSKKLGKTSGQVKSSSAIEHTGIESAESLPGEFEEIGEEELGEEIEMEPRLSEPDIQYSYVVPKGMVDIRTGYKTFSDGKRPEEYQKVGIKLQTNEFEETGRRETYESLANRQFAFEEPHQRLESEGKFNYYEFSKKAMTQVTPKLLLAWAQGIDDDEEVIEIQQAVTELLQTAIKGGPSEIDLEGHPMDAVSMEDTRERFHKCLLSLPTPLLQMLHKAMEDIFERQGDGTEPVVVTGESTSKVQLGTVKTKKMKALSEDVISGIMFSLIDFTKRMVESSTELVPNMKNLDFVTSLIDGVILQKVHSFLDEKEKRPKSPLSDRFEDNAESGETYNYLDTNLLPGALSDVSGAIAAHFSEISDKIQSEHIKAISKKLSSA